jgi:hypothetical protein
MLFPSCASALQRMRESPTSHAACFSFYSTGSTTSGRGAPNPPAPAASKSGILLAPNHSLLATFTVLVSFCTTAMGTRVPFDTFPFDALQALEGLP